jgi:hypothetical protein
MNNAQRKDLAGGLRISGVSVSLAWGGSDYDIALDRLMTPVQLLGWIHHLAEKDWMNLMRMQYFVEQVSSLRGWDIYQ